MTEIALIAVNYFGAGDVERLVRSLSDQEFEAWRLWVVDNSCSQAEAEELRRISQTESRVQVRESKANLGYLGGARFVLPEVLDARPDWVIICNVDLQFASDALEQISSVLDMGVGAIAPSVISRASGLDQNPYMLTRPTRIETWRRRIMFEWLPLSRLIVFAATLRVREKASAKSMPGAAGESHRQIYAAHGSCLVLSARYFELSAALRHEPLLFGEEISVAEHCRSAGLVILYLPEVRVYHAEHAATGTWRSSFILRQQRIAARYVQHLLFTDA